MVKKYTVNCYKGKRHKDHASYFLFPLTDGKKYLFVFRMGVILDAA